MSRLKFIENKYGSYAVFKSEKGQEINRRELELINTNQVKGFLHINVTEIRDKFELEYDLNGLLSLPDFLQDMMLSKRLFSIILKNVIEPFKQVEKMYFNKKLICFDAHQIMIHPGDWNVYYIYLPIQPYEADGNFKEALLEIVRYARFDYSEGYEFVQEFIRIVNTGVPFSAFELEEYIQSLSTEKQKEEESSVRVKSVKRGNEQQYNPIIKEENKLRENEKATSVSNSQISVNEDERGVVTVFRASKNIASTSVWLENKVNASKIIINKNSFRLGKSSREADYKLVDEQNSVSRKHADIIKEQGKYYIVDLGSTNGTFVNGHRIQPGVKEELVNNSVIGIANVEFVFHMD